MLKLNKIVLAIAVALLITTIAELIIIFVYEKPQAKPTDNVTSTNSPAKNAPSPIPTMARVIDADQLKALQNWPDFRNAQLLLTEKVNGIVKSITPATNDYPLVLKLEGQRGLDTVQFNFAKESIKDVKVYIKDATTGTLSVSSLDNLKPKDKIELEFTNDLKKAIEDPLSGTATIYILK